jgi:RimJ/RimL family protein N-acetyltransferase
MNKNLVSVREIQKNDIEPISKYWLNADPAFLTSIGVDLNKMPSKKEWTKMLTEQLAQAYPEKKSYCMIWLVDNKAIGHCNVNKIKFGEEAYMHLHVWNNEFRKKGMGTELVKLSLSYFFKNLELKKIYSEPYALNPAPNKTLEKVGFKFIKEFITIPGWLNFEQPVNLWELTYEQYKDQK